MPSEDAVGPTGPIPTVFTYPSALTDSEIERIAAKVAEKLRYLIPVVPHNPYQRPPFVQPYTPIWGAVSASDHTTSYNEGAN